MEMEITHTWVFQFLAQFAYQPYLVYAFVFFMMLVSAFGLPIPEEVTILSVAILAFMGTRPDLWPPPYVGAPVIEGYQAAIVTFLAVFMSDHLVFFLGRKYGRLLFSHHKLQKIFSKTVMEKIDSFTKKYGIYAAFIFRFTPGIRFPGHIALGMGRFPIWKFSLIDFLAAGVGVPVQILLIYHYGYPILKILNEFKIVFFSVVAIVVLVIVVRKSLEKRAQRRATHRLS